jgi:glucose-6-phosphate isomerase
MPFSSVQSLAGQALEAHYKDIASVHLRDLFAQDPKRFDNFSVSACGLLLDYSKHRITAETRDLLIALAEVAELKSWITRQFSGDKINHTENRAVLHSALRAPADTEILVDGHNVVADVHAVLNSMAKFSDKVRSGEWKGHTGKAIEAIVNIGIGGSDLGPKMVCRALARYQHPRLKAYFASNIDASHIGEMLTELDPETTLFIIASKTFSTQETLTNAQTARRWLVDKLGENAVSKHFVAVSSNAERVSEFGIDTEHMFGFWDWVGGRYSLWSAIGLPIIVNLGMDNFRALLDGAHAMDEHFRSAPFTHNLPVLQGLLGVWYNNFFNASSYAVLPYDYPLELLPMYLQQLEMESNGKRVRRDGETVDYNTSHILWGAAGNNGQHAFYQLLHQGTHLVPADFIVAAHSQYDELGHQNAVLSNALAQTRALMLGRDATETEAMLHNAGLEGDALAAELPHRVFPGNQPSSTIVYDTLTPAILGSLIALYEHKTFVQSVIWDINAFDQWGVELGKQMAGQLLPEFSASEITTTYDASTNGLLNYLKNSRAD